jgi:hypothetical protein
MGFVGLWKSFPRIDQEVTFPRALQVRESGVFSSLSIFASGQNLQYRNGTAGVYEKLFRPQD